MSNLPGGITRASATLAERPLLAAGFLLLAALAVYAPCLTGELIWDDHYLVGLNPFYRSPNFAWEVFRHWLFFDSQSTYYRPIQNWSYILDYWLWRGNPLGYHFSNVFLHGFGGFLLYRLLRQLLPRVVQPGAGRVIPWVALLVSLAWTVHPVHNAAVAYISGRADSLAAVFALLAWLGAAKARSMAAGWRRVLLSIAAAWSALLAFCSKEIALVWAALFVLHLLCCEVVPWRRKWREFGAVVIVFATYAALHALPERRPPVDLGAPLPLADRALLMLRAVGDYTGLMFYPADLYMERTLSDAATLHSARAWRESVRADHLSALGLVALVGAIALCRARSAGQRLRQCGAVWFAVAFLPISNLFPLNAEVAEHWIYLASVGFLLFVAGCFLALPEQHRRVAVGLTCVAITALGIRTAVRASDWRDAVTFCQRTAASGGASPRLLTTLASIHAERGQIDAQERLLRHVVARFPEFLPARAQLAACLHRQGRKVEAGEALATAPAAAQSGGPSSPRTWQAALQVARLRAEAGHAAEARAMLREACARFPDAWLPVEYLARLHVEAHEADAALAVVEAFAAARWWHLEAWQMLGELRAEVGAHEPALAALRHAARLDLYDPRPLKAIARLELERGRGDAAIAAQQAAIRRQPRRGDSYLALAAIFEQLGRRPEAAAAVQTARGLVVRM